VNIISLHQKVRGIFVIIALAVEMQNNQCLFFLIIMLVKYVLSDGISQAFLPFRFVDVIVITDHDLFWNVGQAKTDYILPYFCKTIKDCFLFISITFIIRVVTIQFC
jgi:hypothetical protein